MADHTYFANLIWSIRAATGRTNALPKERRAALIAERLPANLDGTSQPSQRGAA
jgi:flagellar biosynthesis regulator FlaF